jgi:hypothetical protein
MLRKTVLFILLAAFFLDPLAAQNSAPSWYLDKEQEYPGRLYISAVGEGKTRAEAESAAVSQVSLFFNTSTEIRKEAIKEYNEAVTNNTTDFSKKTYISENAVISSDTEFLGVRFANPWQDQRRGVWAALAYINRQEAARMYDSKIAANMASINALAADAARETEALYAASLLNRALPVCDLTEEYIKTAVVVDSAAGKKHEADTAKIQAVRSNFRAKKDSLSFTVTVDRGDSVSANADRIERKLGALLENSGFVVAPARAMYALNARLSAEEETNNAGNFVTPGITIRIERDGKTLFSYSKNYGRAGHRSSMSTAYTRAFMEVEQDLEANFIRQFTATFGR